MTVSTVSTMPLEEIAAAGGGPKWFQLYWPTDRELAASFLARAEAAGYRAIIVTVDTFLPGWKPRDLQRAWQPFLQGVGIANYLADPVFRARLAKPPEEDLQAAVGEFVGVFTNPRLTWEDLEFLRSPHHAADRAQGHPASRRRSRRPRARDGRGGGLQPRRAPDRRRDRLAGRAAGHRRRRRGRPGRAARQRRALAAPTSSRRWRSAPTRCWSGRPYIWGLAVGGEAGVLAVLRALLGRARPHDRPQRPHRARASSTPGCSCARVRASD